MEITTHRARVTAPIPCPASGGRRQCIPVGPCLIESRGERSIEIIWGAQGQSSVTLPSEEINAAVDTGDLVLLD